MVRAATYSKTASRPSYLLAHGSIGLPTLPLYLRTLGGAALLCTGPVLLARSLGRLGARRLQHGLARRWARAVARYLQIQLDVEGLELIDRRRSYLLVSLHEGLADCLALLQLPLNLRFVARDELFTWRYLGSLLRDTGQIAISPEHGMASYRKLLREAGHFAGKQESLVIFPQGTILGIETQFMTGAFALARALSLPILPVVLTGSHRVWEHPYTPLLRYGQRMSLRILPPVEVQEVLAADPRALRDDLQRRMKAAALDGQMAAPRRFRPARDGYWDGYAYEIDPVFAELHAEIARHRRAQGAADRNS